MNEVTLFETITLLAGLVGLWAKMQQELGKLKSRISLMESERDEFRSTLKELLATTQEIKILLARKGIE